MFSLSAYSNKGGTFVENDSQQQRQYHQLRPLSLESNSDSNSSSIFEFKHLDLNEDKITAVDGNCRPNPGGDAASAVRLIINEQPVDKFRFRYKSEMHGTHGSLTGISSSNKLKTYPAVELQGYAGVAVVRCSLHQTGAYRGRPHSHSLVVRNNNEDQRDPHDVRVGVPNSGYGVAFAGMGIIHTAKKFIVEELYEKLLKRYRWIHSKMDDDGGDGNGDGHCVTEFELERLRVQAENEAKQMNLNQVCLCFEAFAEVKVAGGGVRYESLCEPVYSRTINNMKSALTGELKISRLSATCCDAAGNTDLFLFVEKVGKKNIQVRFFELDENEEVCWQGFGQFAESDVHHQYAIALRTPPYRNKDIEENVKVFVQLYRKSDDSNSDPVPFHYKPRHSTITRKRARMCSAFNSAELLVPSSVVQFNNNIQNNTATIANHQHSQHISNIGGSAIVLPTISTEFNTSRMIQEMLEDMPQQPVNSEDLKLSGLLANSADFMHMVDMEELQNEADLLQCDGAAIGAAGGGHVAGSGKPRGSANASGDGGFDIEKRVRLLRAQINRLAQQHSRQLAGECLERLWTAPNTKMDILQLALSHDDTTNDRAAQLVIDMLVDYDLAATLLNLADSTHQHTALHTAALFNRHASIVRMLQLGADPNVADRELNTPLHLAVLESNVDCVQALCNPHNYPSSATTTTHPLHIDAFNDAGYTALQLAIRSQHLQMIQMLTAAGASVSVRGNGNTGLHMAVQTYSRDIVAHVLASVDVDCDMRNGSDMTAADMAGMQPEAVASGVLDLLLQKQQQSNDVAMPTAELLPSSMSSSSVSSSSSSSSTGSIRLRPEAQMTAAATTVRLVDEAYLDELCALLMADGSWRRLAGLLNLTKWIPEWDDGTVGNNPARRMFGFFEAKGVELATVINAFIEMDHRMALGCLDAMLAHRMESQ